MAMVSVVGSVHVELCMANPFDYRRSSKGIQSLRARGRVAVSLSALHGFQVAQTAMSRTVGVSTVDADLMAY